MNQPESPARESSEQPRTSPAYQTKAPSRWSRTEVAICLAIFALALAVRGAYLYESSANPAFYSLTLDSRDYFLRAETLATKGILDSGFFWQPVFYPFAMAVLFLATGPSVLWAKLFQIALGAITCVLTYRLGLRVFDRRTGLLAGLFVAFYGPLIFYEGEIDTAGWAAFWSVALLLLLLRTAVRPTRVVCLLLGGCGSLSVLTRPTFLPFAVVAFVWLTVVLVRGRRGWRQTAGRLAEIIVGFLLAAAPAAIECQRAVGHFGILPTSGGLNVYIGNNENLCRTLTTRPGLAWDELTALAQREGCKTKSEESRYFYNMVWDYAKTKPGSFMKGLGRKALQVINGREVPRNVDIYVFRDWSRVLAALVWKAGRFGFPWGVLFPLAVLGYVLQRRRAPLPLVLFAILYLFGIVLVFVADRYRAPVVPVMAILGAAGCTSIVDILRTRQRLHLTAACCIAVAVIGTTNLAGRSCEEEVNYASEMQYLLAQNAESAGQIDEALRLFQKALELEPGSCGAHFRLGVALARAGRLDEAIEQFNATLQCQDYYIIYYNRGSAYLLKHDLDRALSDLDAAIAKEPQCPACYCRRASLYREQGEYGRARLGWERVLEMTPTGPFADEALAGLKLLPPSRP